MNDPFFIQPGNKRKTPTTSAFPERDQKKRKVDGQPPKPQYLKKTYTKPIPGPKPKGNIKPQQNQQKGWKKLTQPKQKEDQESEEEDLDEVESEENQQESQSEEEDQFEGETVDEKRIRVAKEYLEKLKAMTQADENSDKEDSEIDNILKAESLRQRTGQRMESLQVANQIREIDFSTRVQFRKCHQLSVTTIAISDDESTLFSGSKDCCVIQWTLTPELTKVHSYFGSRKPRKGSIGHTHHVLAVAVSTDGEFFASGGIDRSVRVWSTKQHKCVHTLKGHRDSVTCLGFRFGSHDLYSGSSDRTIKMWDIDSGGYLDTLYGHQSSITAIDSLRKERCVSSASDSTTRLWKIAESSQLVFRSDGSGSIDTVSYLSEDTWVSGNAGGEIELWCIEKKKPTAVIKEAHGKTGAVPNWVSAVAGLRYSDIVASGSCDGNIKLWEVRGKSIKPVAAIPINGWVNSLKFSSNGKFLIAGIGQEPALGRWSTVPTAKNGICVITLNLKV